MSATCAIIVCDHGLGHVRRCALMAKQRERLGEQVTLFAPVASLNRLQRAIPHTGDLAVYDFVTNTSPQFIRQGIPEAVQWVDRLPDLDHFDTVVCDNLPEILARRPDAIISAQFFWHDVIQGAAKDYIEYCDELLASHEPTIIGCAQFAMDAVRSQPGFKPVGLYKNPELVTAAAAALSKKRTDLLVTGGTTPTVREHMQMIIDKLLNNGPEPYQRVYVDPELMINDAPYWMSVADFSVQMFSRINTAICRPGLGILTDLITMDIKPYLIYEESNNEMIHNAKVMEELFSGEILRGEGGKWL